MSLASQPSMSPGSARLLILLSFAVACGGESKGAGSGGTGMGGTGSGGEPSAGTAGTAGTGSFTPDPGCESDGDCAGDQRGSTCFRFEDEARGFCGDRVAPLTECGDASGVIECCTSEECVDSRCFRIVTQPVQCSGGAGFDVANQCVPDACENDEDCAEGLCAPDGLGAGRACVPAACRSDADCSDEPGGACAYFDLGCCRYQIGGGPKRTPEIACVYPSSGCQADTDCSNGELCVVRDGRAECSATCP